jgi:hypothetical protein
MCVPLLQGQKGRSLVGFRSVLRSRDRRPRPFAVHPPRVYSRECAYR